MLDDKKDKNIECTNYDENQDNSNSKYTISSKNVSLSVLPSANNETDNAITIKSEILKNKKVISIVIFTILLVLIGLVNFEYNSPPFPYWISLVFFIAGLCAGLFEESSDSLGFVFLLGHGGMGIITMFLFQIPYILSNPIVSDLGLKIYFWIWISIILVIIGFILAIIYNKNSCAKSSMYFLYSILICFLLSISIIEFIPLIYNFS
jgi:hypothetical protein